MIIYINEMKISKILDSKFIILDNSNNLIDPNYKYLYIQNINFKDLVGKNKINIIVDFNKLNRKKMGKIIRHFWKMKKKYMLKFQSSSIVFANCLLDFSMFDFYIINYSDDQDKNEFLLLLKSICYEYQEQTYKHLLNKFLNQYYEKDELKQNRVSKYKVENELKRSIIYTSFFNFFQKKKVLKYLYKFYKYNNTIPLGSFVKGFEYL